MNAFLRKICYVVDFLSAPEIFCGYDESLVINLFLFFSLIQSMVAFLKDPSGPPLWEENPEAKDVVHVETEKVSRNLNDLVSFK